MSIDLIESKRRSQKSVHGAAVSIALHAGLITVAVYATANAGEVRPSLPHESGTVIYTSPPTETHRTSGGAPQHVSPPATPRLLFRKIVVPGTAIPRIEVPFTDTWAENVFVNGPAGSDTRSVTGTSGPESGEPMLAAQVDKPAMARDGNPIPKYPSLLESSRVEGSVLVQFVVDTLGRAEMSTFAVLQSSNELFARSLQEALPRWRFYPAEAGGRKVKQIVQLPLRFVAPPLH
jgi:protein TonB